MVELINGDCLEQMKALPDNSIDLTVTSPPYDNLRTYKDSLDWGEHVWMPVLQDLFRVTKQGGVVVWVVGDATIKGSETGTSFKQALWAMECGFRLHDTMIYEKSGFSNPSSNRCHQVFEYMFILSKGKPNVFNQIKDRKNKYRTGGGGSNRKPNGEIVKTGTGKVRGEYGGRYNIWKYSNGGGHITSLHPAGFSKKLAHDHIISWSNEGDTVFDPFMGSGTTGKMAKQLNRKFIGIEKVEEYFKIATSRIESAKEDEDE